MTKVPEPVRFLGSPLVIRGRHGIPESRCISDPTARVGMTTSRPHSARFPREDSADQAGFHPVRVIADVAALAEIRVQNQELPTRMSTSIA